MSSPDLTIVLATRNRAQLLPQILAPCDEIAKFLALEVIVVDDESSDETYVTLLALSRTRRWLHPLWQKQAGIAAARNLGLRAASGAAVLFLGEDQQVLADGVCAAYTLLAENFGVDVVCCDLKQGDLPALQGSVLRQPPIVDFATEVLAARVLDYCGAYLYRRSAIAQLTWSSRYQHHPNYGFLSDWIATGALPKSRVCTAVVAVVPAQTAAHAVEGDVFAKDYEYLDQQLRAAESLKHFGRLTRERSQAVVDGAWVLSHPFAYRRFSKLWDYAERITQIAPNLCPSVGEKRGRFSFYTLFQLLHDWLRTPSSWLHGIWRH